MEYFQTTKGDPRVDHYFLMHSPIQPLVITILYLTFLLKIGPLYMKNKEPLKLTILMTIYNVSQIICNGYIFLMCLTIVPHFSVWCSPSIKSNSPFDLYCARAHYLFTILKLYDFVETIIYVLRKKEKQVSFLHLYHHVGTYLSSWFSCKYFPGGQPIFTATMNTFIHLVMYIYYLASSWIDAKYLWWKKYITLVQIVQHFMIFFIYVIPLVNPNCSYSKHFLWINVIYMMIMIYLFRTFYQRSYIAEKKKCN